MAEEVRESQSMRESHPTVAGAGTPGEHEKKYGQPLVAKTSPQLEAGTSVLQP